LRGAPSHLMFNVATNRLRWLSRAEKGIGANRLPNQAIRANSRGHGFNLYSNLAVLALAPFDPSFALMENNRDVTRKSMLVLVLEKSFYPIIATIVDSIIATIAAGPSARSAEVG
jgi:hypothetical protein